MGIQASAANGGIGGPPVGAVHSGVFLPIVPVGGGSVFGNDPKHLKGTNTKDKQADKTKVTVRTKLTVRTKSTHTSLSKRNEAQSDAHDAALVAIVAAKTPKHVHA